MSSETDEMLESSTSESVSDTGTPAEDSAPDSQAEGSQPTADHDADSGHSKGLSSADPDGKPKSVEEPSILEQAIDRLTGKTKRDAQKAEREAKASAQSDQKKPETAKKDDKQAAIDPDALTEFDKRAHPQTRERIKSLIAKTKDVTTKHEALQKEYGEQKSNIDAGTAFHGLVKEYDLLPDLTAIGPGNDHKVAAAIKFQASIDRFAQGKATKADEDRVKSVWAAMDADRDALGYAPAPAIDAAALEKAIDKAEANLDFEEVRKLLSDIKAKSKTEPAPVQNQPQRRQPTGVPAEQPRQQPTQPQQPQDDPEDMLLQAKLISRVTADGIADAKSYFKDHVFPLISPQLVKINAQASPLATFWKLSPRSRHDLVIEAHEELQKKAKAIKARETKPAPQQRPGRPGSGIAPAWSKSHESENTVEAAINRLSRPA